MPRFWGPRSKAVYDTLDPRLQSICNQILQEYADISLICGHRNQVDQDKAFADGKSQKKWPDGNHNKSPSLAVDLQPHPVPEQETKLRVALGYIAGVAIVLAKNQHVKLRWGGDWNMNGSVTDNSFDDLYHLEII